METDERRGAERLKRLDSLAYLLDNSIPIPGTGARVGLDALIGLVPGIGDVAGTAMSGYIVMQAARMGAPASVIARMVPPLPAASRPSKTMITRRPLCLTHSWSWHNRA